MIALIDKLFDDVVVSVYSRMLGAGERLLAGMWVVQHFLTQNRRLLRLEGAKCASLETTGKWGCLRTNLGFVGDDDRVRLLV